MKKKTKAISILLTGVALAIGIAVSNGIIQNAYHLDEAKAATNVVTYTITAKNTVTVSGTAPSGSSATLVETYATSKQITDKNSQTLTLSGWNGNTINSITLSMKSNASSGQGSFTYSVNGGSSFSTLISNSKFNSASWRGSWSTSYVPVTKNGLSIAATTLDLVFKIAATDNSLYCESYSFSYVKNQVLQSISVVTPPLKTSYFVGESIDTNGLLIRASYDVGDPVDVTSSCTFNPSSFSSAGTNVNVTASYTDGGVTKQATIDGFTVSERNLVSIAVTTNPTKMSYVTGESLNTSGMVITASYDAGSPVIGYTNYNVSPSVFNVVGSQEVTISDKENSGIFDTINVSVSQAPTESTYTYTEGDGNGDGNVRTYDIGQFIMTQRKNGSSSEIAASYAELRIYSSHSMEIVPKALGTKRITAIQVTASTDAYATAMGAATIIAGASSSTASSITGISSVASSVATFNLSSVSNCEFVKFTLGAQSRTLSWKITYAVTSTPQHETDAVAYGTSFLSATADGCSTANSSTLSGVWASLESSYNALSNDAKAYLTGLTPNVSGNDAQHAVARYIHIITKYGEATFNDFMNLDLQSAPSSSDVLALDSHDFLPLIAVISVVGLTILIGYYYHNKRKEA